MFKPLNYALTFSVALLVAGLTLNANAKELRVKHTILSGVFYTAGGSGGEHSLHEEEVEALCNAGYSTIYYLYTRNFSNKGTNHCANGKLDYQHASWEGQATEIFDRVQQVLDNGGGPVLAHCYNGRHAAGAVAAKALIQFCGWSNEEAVEWWYKYAGDGKKYPHVPRDIKAYKVSGRYSTHSSRCP